MIPEGYVQALADYADAIESDDSLVAERDALYARMTAKPGKGGKEIINGELNGKQFGFQISMTVEEKFTAFTQAVKLYNGKTVPMTYGVFPFLVR